MADPSPPTSDTSVPNVLTIAGVDPSGGAGVLADVKTMSALGAYACAVVTALTAQNTQRVAGVHAVPASFVALQIDTLFEDVRIDAVKIGMLGDANIARAVGDRLAHWRPAHVVLDPVMVSKSGAVLLAADALAALRDALLPQATVLTPNLPEAAALLGSPAAGDEAAMRRAAEQLRRAMASEGERWVLLKGGHLPAGDALDLLFDGERMIELRAPRLASRNTHGTGCTLSAALAALLPRSPSVPDAARAAKAYLTEAIRCAAALRVGRGHGPLHHFHAIWRSARAGS